MQVDLKRFLFFLAVSINVISVVISQYNEETDYHPSYSIENSILKSVEYIATSEKFKNLSEEEINLLNGIPNFVLPLPVGKMLKDLLKEDDSTKCGRDLNYIFENVLAPGLWRLKMLDSYGKPESGILLGNFRWLGDYGECLEVYAPPNDNEGNATAGDFHGQYCTLTTTIKFGKLNLNLASAVCLPDSCEVKAKQEKNDTKALHAISPLDLLGSLFQDTSISCKPVSKGLSAGAIITLLILAIIIFLAVVGSSITVFEYYVNEKSSEESVGDLPTTVELSTKEDAINADHGHSNNERPKQVPLPDFVEKIKPFFNCFCIFTNGEKLLNTDSAEGQLPCLHGIRVLSMTWIVMCHVYNASAAILKNVLDAPKFIDGWFLQVVVNGFFSVDSFFVLSGFLVAYLFFKQADKTGGKIPWLYFYIHRYVRLTPVYLLVLLFFTFVFPLMGSGPLWTDSFSNFCTKNWWWNVLYINNFAPQSEQCIPWAWYLANDMQFYIICPLFLITLWKWPKIGYAVLGVGLCVPIIASFVLTLKYDLMASLNSVLRNPETLVTVQTKIDEYFKIIYYKPYARIGPYLIGILLAYVLHIRKKQNADKLNRIVLTVGWLLAAGLTLTVQFGTYKEHLNKVGAAFYNAFGRIVFGFGLSWVIFVCVEGQADAVNRILSWKAWIPFSRLTYSVYLVHPLVMNHYFQSLNSLIYFTHPVMFMLYLGFLIVSYTAALLVSLLLESPVIRLEKLLRTKLMSK